MFQQSPNSDPEVVKRATMRASYKRVPFWFQHLAESMPNLKPERRAEVALAVIRMLMDKREPAAKQRAANLASLAQDLLKPGGAEGDAPPRVG